MRKINIFAGFFRPKTPPPPSMSQEIAAAKRAVVHFALDYDKTFTADPVLWRAFIRMCKLRGHVVRIVTARDERHDNTEALFKLEREIPVIWCRGVAKRWWVKHFHPDFPVDIWIDDKPEAVIENSPTEPHDLKEWRSTRNEGQHYGRT